MLTRGECSVPRRIEPYGQQSFSSYKAASLWNTLPN